MDIVYHRTWCDYLTKCPNLPKRFDKVIQSDGTAIEIDDSVEVGSQECCECKFHLGHREQSMPNVEGYDKYFIKIQGEVACNYDTQSGNN